ncbi:MAG TPA: dephospho-CoA kinase [Candidatus Cybelea sp.]|jgi:dephospho-CoA kinase
MLAGLTGGIGSGKSTVAALFHEFGALIVDTDLVAREAVAPNSDGFLQIAHIWPDVIRDGELDRGALAAIVFEDPAQRERLNAIVHPEVRRIAAERSRQAAPGQLVVHVVPLLFETGYDKLVDRTIVVVAPKERRLARVEARDGLSDDAVLARMSAQIAPERAIELADYVIENDSSIENVRERSRAVYEAIVSAERG